MRASPLDDPAAQPPCSVCGLPLAGDPDDQPLHPTGALCGACVRAREFDETLWELDLANEDEAW